MSQRFSIVILAALAAFVGGLLALWADRTFGDKPAYDSISERQKTMLTGYKPDSVRVPAGLNFQQAASRVAPAVVHIRSNAGKAPSQQQSDEQEQFEQFHRRFYDAPRESSGSGVILTDDGYIATNSHVVEDAETVEVILVDKRSFAAKIIGVDPSTDLALLKIEAKGLPFVPYGNSDKLSIGEWVLAIGNPLDLTNTVTAGIVSAKARNIQILRDREGLQIESFIQTDAAVNPGNSGGALVNLQGELVGINTAIASQTGFYTGYSFAVPVTLVRKVMDDILKFGEVQRALLGVVIMEMNADLAKDKGIELVPGVYVADVNPKSAAAEAGLIKGDVITAVNGQRITASSELQERVAQYRPGDKVTLTYLRGSAERTAKVTLKNKLGNTDRVKKSLAEAMKVPDLGATVRPTTDKEQRDLEIEGGLKVIDLDENGKLALAGVQNGFVITTIDRQAVTTVKELQAAISDRKGGVLIEGIYTNGKRAYYAFGW